MRLKNSNYNDNHIKRDRKPPKQEFNKRNTKTVKAIKYYSMDLDLNK